MNCRWSRYVFCLRDAHKQIGVRAVMLIVAAVAVALAIARHEYQYRASQNAADHRIVEALRRKGCLRSFETKRETEHCWDVLFDPRAPERTCVVAISVDLALTDEEGFSAIAHLARLERLHCVGPVLTPHGITEAAQRESGQGGRCTRAHALTRTTIDHLSRLPQLLDFRVENCSINDGLHHIGKLERLEAVWLINTDVSDVHLRSLCTCRKLRVLNISKGSLSDQAMAHLCEHPTLQVVYFVDHGLSDVAMRRFTASAAGRWAWSSDRWGSVYVHNLQ